MKRERGQGPGSLLTHPLCTSHWRRTEQGNHQCAQTAQQGSNCSRRSLARSLARLLF